MGPGLRYFFSSSILRHFGSCQGSDGSEGGRARGLGLRSEVLFSRRRGEIGLGHAPAWRDGMNAFSSTQVRSEEARSQGDSKLRCEGDPSAHIALANGAPSFPKTRVKEE